MIGLRRETNWLKLDTTELTVDIKRLNRDMTKLSRNALNEFKLYFIIYLLKNINKKDIVILFTFSAFIFIFFISLKFKIDLRFINTNLI